MSYQPDRFVVTAIVRDVDDGEVIAEKVLEPVVLFGCDQLAEWAAIFPGKLAEAIERDPERAAS